MADIPDVTVIIPAYNAAWSLRATLDSVRSQSLENFEAVVIDDGSSDDTAAVAQAVVDLDSRFRLHRQPNGRVAKARNRGVAEARGRYVAPLDSDDVWAPRFLERLVAELDRRPQAVFAFARSTWIDADGRDMPMTEAPFPTEVGYVELLLRNPVGNSSSSVMRTAAVRALGGYDEGIVRRHGCTEDWLLMMQLSWRGEVVPIDEHLVGYRITERSASHALHNATGGMLEAVDRVRREGPRLPRAVYARARGLSALWLLRRAVAMRRWDAAFRLALLVVAANPAWVRDRRLRRAVMAGIRRKLGLSAKRGADLIAEAPLPRAH